jgi:restriction system protein
MAIPNFEELMLPILKFISDTKVHTSADILENIIETFDLSEEEINQLVPNSNKPVIYNRFKRGKYFLRKAGLIKIPDRGFMEITDKGLNVLIRRPIKFIVKSPRENPIIIYDELVKPKIKLPESSIHPTEMAVALPPPTSDLAETWNKSTKPALKEEIFDRLKNKSMYFFERVILKLLSNMGYEKTEVTNRSADGEISGLITQDKLGLNKIYFQARWLNDDTYVTDDMIHSFIGALELKGAKKGAFITTAKFPEDIKRKLSNVHKNIVLIDRDKLLELMVEYDVGVTLEKVHKVNRIDTDFFIQ